VTTAIPAEGRVDLRIEWDGHAVRHAEVRSRRPQPSALLLGRAPEYAQTIIPRLYSLCGDAQSVASEALEAALGAAAPDAVMRENWSDRIRLENIREHLWRLGLDWPRVAGVSPQPDPLRELLAARSAFLVDRPAAADWAVKTLDRVFGQTPPAWLDDPAPELFDRWLHEAPTPLAALLARLQPRLTALGRSALPLLPAGNLQPMARDVLSRLRSDPHFHWRPDWNGNVFEMGPLARAAQHPLVATLLARHGAPDAWLRVVARVVELAGMLHGLSRGLAAAPRLAWHSDAEEAVVALDMVRGVLLHWIRVGTDGILDYRIVAPTEWNFHPEGPARQGLLQLRAENEAGLRDAVTLQVMALDPCVQYELEIVHA